MSLTSKIQQQDVDNLYYEVTIPNTSNTTSYPVRFSETRVEPLIPNSNDWQVIVSDFNLPASQIPLFIFEEHVPYAPPALPTDFSKGYWITIDWGANSVSVPVRFSPTQSNGNVPSPYNLAIYNYTLFLQQVNTALHDAWVLVGLDNFFDTGIVRPPFIYYNSTTQLFEFNYLNTLFPALALPQMYNGETPLGTPATIPMVKIYFNFKLHKFFKFPSLSMGSPATQYPTPRDYLISFYDTQITTTSTTNSPFPTPYNTRFYTLTQEYSTISKWMRYTKILFFTNSIPVVNRQIGNINAGGVNQNFSVLTSFELADNELFDRSNIQFNSGGGTKWISLLPSGCIRTLDITVQFMGIDSTDILQAYISPGEKFSCTLWFNRKEENVFDKKVYGAVTDLAPMLSQVIMKVLESKQAEKEDQAVKIAMEPRPLIKTISGSGVHPKRNMGLGL